MYVHENVYQAHTLLFQKYSTVKTKKDARLSNALFNDGGMWFGVRSNTHLYANLTRTQPHCKKQNDCGYLLRYVLLHCCEPLVIIKWKKKKCFSKNIVRISKNKRPILIFWVKFIEEWIFFAVSVSMRRIWLATRAWVPPQDFFFKYKYQARRCTKLLDFKTNGGLTTQRTAGAHDNNGGDDFFYISAT